jgi:DNA-binding GntR family transcriptional regulator
VELATLGIVGLLPNRGAIVRPFGALEVSEISEIRRLLELEAVRRSCGRIEQSVLAQLDDDLSSLAGRAHDHAWDREIRELDTRLHGVIAESCGMGRLTEEIERYLGLFRTLRDFSHGRDAWTNYSRSNDIPEHCAIVQALRAGDPDASAAAMDRHIRSAARKLIEVMFGKSEPLDRCHQGGAETTRTAGGSLPST